MQLEVKATKTYREFINANPDFFDGMSEFAWDEDEQKYVNVPVKDVTKELIDKWFGSRIVCSDENFERFFSRQFNLCALRYSQLSRIELSSFDPLVADYMERRATNNNTRSMSSSKDANKSNASNTEINKTQNSEQDSENTRTPNLTSTDTGTRSNTDSAIDNKIENSNSESRDVAMNKIAPMSISYENSTGGPLPNLDWSYATGQDQKENTTNVFTTENDTHTGDSKESYSNTREDSGNEKTIGNTTATATDNSTCVITGSETSNETGTSTETGDSEDKEVRTGRGGLTPQEAFRTAVSYLKTSSAWEWMRSQLEECFLSVYDI